MSLELIINQTKTAQKAGMIEISTNIVFLGAEKKVVYETVGKDDKGRKIKNKENQIGWHFLFSELGTSRTVWVKTSMNGDVFNFLSTLKSGKLLKVSGLGYDISYGALMIQEQVKVVGIGNLVFEK